VIISIFQLILFLSYLTQQTHHKSFGEFKAKLSKLSNKYFPTKINLFNAVAENQRWELAAQAVGLLENTITITCATRIFNRIMLIRLIGGGREKE